MQAAVARLAPDAPPEALELDVLRDAAGAPTGLRLAWLAPPVAPGERAIVPVAVGGADVARDVRRFETRDTETGREWWHSGRPVLGFEHGYDAARHADTFRTFHHLAGLHGEGWLTKGPGGKYPHQRGVFVGFDRILVGNQRHDLWTIDEVRRPRQLHDSFTDEHLGIWRARHTSRGRWLGNGGVLIADEARTVELWRPSHGLVCFDHEVALTPRVTTSFLGNPAHAGVHVRLAERWFTATQQGRLVLPADATDHPYDGDSWTARWCAFRFSADERVYALVQLAHPANPPGAPPVFNGRGYGRFGAFSEHRAARGEALVLRHRFVLVEAPGEEAALRARAEALAGAYAQPPQLAVRRLR